MFRDHMPVGRDDRFVIRRDVFAFHRDLIASRHRHRQMVQKSFRIDRRHATGPGRRDSLPIDRILRVAAGEDPGNVCPDEWPEASESPTSSISSRPLKNSVFGLWPIR